MLRDIQKILEQKELPSLRTYETLILALDHLLWESLDLKLKKRLFDFLIAFSIARKAYNFFLFPVSLDASFVTIIFTMFIFASMKNHHQHPNTHLDKNEKLKIFSEYYNKLVTVCFRDGNNTFFV